MKKKVDRVIGITLLALFLSYYGGSNFFTHSHLIDGKIQTHSHPHKPFQKHSHTTSAFYAIQGLNSFVLISGIFLFTAAAAVSLIPALSTIGAEAIYIGRFHEDVSPLRGPPSFFANEI